MAVLEPGLHIKVWSSAPISSSVGFPGWHHGIVSQVNGASVSVIHFCRPESGQEPRAVRETSLGWFLHGGRDEQVVDGEPAFEFKEVVARARRYLGAGRYSLPCRNCEHFASWCHDGYAFSSQVHRVGLIAGCIAMVMSIVSVTALGMARNQSF